MLPWLRWWTTGAVEGTRWRTLTVSNATALYFLSIVGPMFVLAIYLERYKVKWYYKYPIIFGAGIAMFFVAGLMGQTTTPFRTEW